MLDDFMTHNDPLLQGKKLLLAVSGGMDSMVMTTLCLKANYDIVIAHVDHHTRDGQSTKDALFVHAICKKHCIPFHLGNYYHQTGNFQAEARTFRYKFFKKIIHQENLDLILTAHHKDDQRAGFLLNAFRGSHLTRLTTPNHFDENMVRPLIFFGKNDLKNFANDYQIDYVEDDSNQDNSYNRNFIRQEIIKRIEYKFPQGIKGIDYTIASLSKSKILLDSLMSEWLIDNVRRTGKQVTVNLRALRSSHAPSLLALAMADYQFSKDTWNKVLVAKTGAIFTNEHYQMIKKSGELLIIPKENNDEENQSLHIPHEGIYRFASLEIEINKINRNKPVEAHDFIKLPFSSSTWPIEIRYWKAGDTFMPKGMQGKRKKVKKLLTDLKVDRLNKMKTVIIKDQEKILWVYPYRKARIKVDNMSDYLIIAVKSIR